MNTVERPLSGEVIRQRHNLDYSFRRVLAEPRNQDALSAEMDLEGKPFVQVMHEYAELKKSKGCVDVPETVGQAFLQFTAERNVVSEKVIALAFRLGCTYDFDEKLQ